MQNKVLLLFVLMSGHKKLDYRKVFEELLEILLSAQKLQQITLDFEKVTWAALRKVLHAQTTWMCLPLNASPLEKGEINSRAIICSVVDKRTKNNLYGGKSSVHIFSGSFGSVVDKRTTLEVYSLSLYLERSDYLVERSGLVRSGHGTK